MVGLCSLDPPNIGQVKERGSYGWLGAGYDLETPTLEAISKGFIGVSAGQQPYLQGYLPVRALVEELKSGKNIFGLAGGPDRYRDRRQCRRIQAAGG